MEKVDIIAENEWLVDIDEKVKTMEASSSLSEKERRIRSKQSIYRVQPHIRQMKEAVYTPQVVSFGPYHHCDPRLKKMEEHKSTVLLHVLKRQNKSICVYMNALEQVVEQLMDCYADLDQKWREDPSGFLKLMIQDGCFLLEILKTSDQKFPADYANNDPIFSSHGMQRNKPAIKRDMILVENQLPLLLLHKLFAVEGPGPNMETRLSDLIRTFIGSTVIQKACSVPAASKGNAASSGTPADINAKDEKTLEAGLDLHVLDVVRKSLIKTSPPPMVSTDAADTGGKILSATRLREAGIRFRGIGSGSLRDVTLKNSTLQLPVLIIDDATESTLLNLMAFEKLHMEVESHVTSYVCFMDEMIDTEMDVRLLHSKGVVVNVLGSDKHAADLFNRIAEETIVDPQSSLLQVSNDANRHCKKKWNIWRANFKQTYLSNPWVFISFLAAIVLLALTVLQTIYAILPFHRHKGGNS